MRLRWSTPMSTALAREAKKLMLQVHARDFCFRKPFPPRKKLSTHIPLPPFRCPQPSWLGMLDLMVAPAIDDFVLTQALRMPTESLLYGAKCAAVVVNGAMHAALEGDTGIVKDLERTHSLVPCLHKALGKEIAEAMVDASLLKRSPRRTC